MKKIMLLVLVLGCTVLLSSSVFAVSTFTTKTAAVTFAAGTVTFDVALKNVSGNAPATAITWNTANITMDSATEDWEMATVYADLTANITDVRGKVYVYQDNKSATGNYVAVSSRTEVENSVTSGKYNGLVKSGSNGGQEGYIPMSFRVSTVTLNTAAIIPSNTGTYAYLNRYLTDKNDTNYVAHADYTLIANADGFVINTTATPGVVNNILPKSTTAKMFFGAGFKNVKGSSSYGTDKIIFEMVTE